MKIQAIEGNRQRLDGGAMYGNCPRALWARWSPPDERGRIDLACRAMLVEDGERKILLETGIGAFFDPKMRDRFGVLDAGHILLDSLRAVGLGHEDIDVVVLSHLHFDHAGGLLAPYEEGRAPTLLFPNARFLVGKRALERATHPHRRDRASFIPELPGLLEASGRLEIVDGERSETLGDRYLFHLSDGHTPGLLLTEIETDDGPLLFCGDLIPGAPWMHLAITMGYDRYPERLIDEKERILTSLLERGGRVFFTHDANQAFARVTKDAKGRFAAG